MNGNSAATADTIYTGGNFITVNDAQPTAEALAVKDGRILAVGTAEEVLKTQGNLTRLVDLGGKTLLPGFIDAHSHIAGYESMKWGYPDLTPPPVGDVRRITDIVARLKAFIAEKKLPVGQLVVGMGYDDSLLEDQRHPTRADLDQVSTDHPVLAVHASGHLLAANSYALKMVNYNRETVDPNGGVIRRDTTGEPNGVCEELAAFAFVALMKPKPMDDQVANLVEIQNYYASYGITTAQDGMSMDAEIALLREAATRNLLSLDIVSYPRWDMFNDVLRGERKLNIEYHPPMNCCDPLTADGPISVEPVIHGETKVQVGIYQNHLKFAGIKINADGFLVG